MVGKLVKFKSGRMGIVIEEVVFGESKLLTVMTDIGKINIALEHVEVLLGKTDDQQN
tara:strand:- start:48 stop:218 length:171 start_codon:yes stop_codon:yes gene_type:complete